MLINQRLKEFIQSNTIINYKCHLSPIYKCYALILFDVTKILITFVTLM